MSSDNSDFQGFDVESDSEEYESETSKSEDPPPPKKKLVSLDMQTTMLQVTTSAENHLSGTEKCFSGS
jgi:hypothetical protein